MSRDVRWTATSTWAVACAVAVAVFTPHLRAQEASAPTDAPAELVVTADDFNFDAPASFPAGRTAVRIVNRGTEIHHVQLVRMDDGRTLEELLAAMEADGITPAWARELGGPNAAPPGGGEVSALVDLRPGSYALLCMVPSPDGVLHVMKGMSRALTVTEAATSAPPPASIPADITLTLTDYAFAFSKALTAGTHRIRVVGSGRQAHEFVVFRLADGKTSADLLGWFEGGQQGPPPAMPVGGVVGLSPGEENEITVTFEPGTYSFACFLPDIDDRAPHFVHGMVQDYKIR